MIAKLVNIVLHDKLLATLTYNLAIYYTNIYIYIVSKIYYWWIPFQIQEYEPRIRTSSFVHLTKVW